MINLKDISFGGHSRIMPITKQPSFANLEGKKVKKIIKRQETESTLELNRTGSFGSTQNKNSSLIRMVAGQSRTTKNDSTNSLRYSNQRQSVNSRVS
jgi:hypothetical protein